MPAKFDLTSCDQRTYKSTNVGTAWLTPSATSPLNSTRVAHATDSGADGGSNDLDPELVAALEDEGLHQEPVLAMLEKAKV